MLTCLGNVLSDCFCEENAKFSEYLLKKYTQSSLVRVNTLATFNVYMPITRFYSDEERTSFGLLDWTFLNVKRKPKTELCFCSSRKRISFDEIAMSNVAH